MADKSRGYISIWRCIEDNALWQSDKPFDIRSAWIDLLLMANHKDREIIIDSNPLLIRRGERFTSIRKLAERWHWNKDRVLRYMRMLVSLGMIQKSETRHGTLITIVNYSQFQDGRDSERDTNTDTGGYTGRDTSTDADTPQTIMKNNVNNDSNNGNNIGRRPFSEAYKDVKWQ